MPKLLERSGTAERGSITGFYTILVDGDEMDEPVSDTVRGILDGHIVLSRDLAQAYHYPAIDVLRSVSRLAPAVSGPVSKKAEAVIRRNMAVYAEAEDLISVGAYHPGSNPATDEAIARHGPIEEFLIQAVDERSSLTETLSQMAAVSGVSIPDDEMLDRDQAALPGAQSAAKNAANAAAAKPAGPRPQMPGAAMPAGIPGSVASLLGNLNILNSAGGSAQ
jgi:flagellum-specific ATP synthase